MTALSMTLVGTRGGTEAELKKALHLEGANAKPLHDKVGGMMSAVTKGGCTKLANRIFSEKSFAMLADFKALLTSSYAAELGQVSTGDTHVSLASRSIAKRMLASLRRLTSSSRRTRP